MFIDPEAELGERILPVMLTPPLPANENSPLATTGGGSSVRLGALPAEQFPRPAHRTRDADGNVVPNGQLESAPFRRDGLRTNPCQSPLKSNVAGEAYVNTPFAAWPHRSVTITSTVPAAWAGIDK